MKTIFSKSEVTAFIEKLAHQLNKAYPSFDDVVFLGIQQGGVIVANDIVEEIKKMIPGKKINYGQIDITFYRDDIRKEILAPDKMNLPFAIENKRVVLIDDVLFTGRTIKAALDVILDYGRPAKVELCVLIDRKEHRQFPIQADYIGKEVKTEKADKVKLINSEVVLVKG